MLNNKKRERNVCSVTNCRSYREACKWPEPLTFHEFPADLKRRALWLKALGKEDWIPSDKAKVCAVHFTPESYRDLNYTAIAHALGVNLNNKPVRRLTNTAVPSLHLHLEPLELELPRSTQHADCNSYDPLQPAQLFDPLHTQSSESPSTAQFNRCIVPNCQQYRDANCWSDPLVLYDFPLDLERRSLWVESLRKNVIGAAIPNRGRICSVHFDKDDFRDPNKKLLKPKAVPILNLTLPLLSEKPTDTSNGLNNESLPLRYKTLTAHESRKRTSNIIVVDLMKESKKTKCPEKQTVFENDCAQCLQLLKEVRDVEYQLAEARSELRQQKQLVETLKSQLGSKGETIVPS